MSRYPPLSEASSSTSNGANPSSTMSSSNPTNNKVIPIQEVPEHEIDYSKSNESFLGIRFIMECGRKLELEAITVATAASLFHKFFSVTKKADYDQYLIASACLYLAGKLEESSQLKIRDLMNVVHTTLHIGADPMSLDSEYYAMREAICNAELLVLRMVNFQAKFTHPHKYLLHHLKTLKAWISEEVWLKYPIAQTSWSLLQDFYHDKRVLDYDRSHTSIACIFISLQTFGIQVPYIEESDKKSWYNVLSETITKESLWELMTIIMEVYNNDTVLVQPSLREIKS